MTDARTGPPHLTLIHTEEFHSTPETQTDEAYNHPEDLEHFAHHEDIERQEAEREARFQGISVDEALKQHDAAEAKAAADEHAAQNGEPNVDGQPQEHSFGGEQIPVGDEPQRVLDPIIRFRNMKVAESASAEAEAATFKSTPRGERVKCVQRLLLYYLCLTCTFHSRKTAPYKVL